MRKNQQKERHDPYELWHQSWDSPGHTTEGFPDMVDVESVWSPQVQEAMTMWTSLSLLTSSLSPLLSSGQSLLLPFYLSVSISRGRHLSIILELRMSFVPF